MIQIRSVLTVLDTSGVREIRSFDVPGKKGGSRATAGVIGDKVTGSVFRLRPGSVSELKKGDVVRGVLVTTKKGLMRANGTAVLFPENGVVLVTEKGEPLGVRIRACLPIDLRAKGHRKLLLMADSIV